jgi:thiosulfate reductase cytochrome b subunit
MHYADANWSFLPFRWAVLGHNTFGVTSVVLWITFMALNLVSGNVRHYLPLQRRALGDLWLQVRHYAWGMFRGEPPPFPYGLGDKFNPVQKLAYVVVMYGLLPLSIASGLVLLFPLVVAAHPFGRAGLWPVAMVHLATGWLMCLFMLVHVYLATTGERVTTLYREMLTGVRHSTFPPPPARSSSTPPQPRGES